MEKFTFWKIYTSTKGIRKIYTKWLTPLEKMTFMPLRWRENFRKILFVLKIFFTWLYSILIYALFSFYFRWFILLLLGVFGLSTKFLGNFITIQTVLVAPLLLMFFININYCSLSHLNLTKTITPGKSSYNISIGLIALIATSLTILIMMSVGVIIMLIRYSDPFKHTLPFKMFLATSIDITVIFIGLFIAIAKVRKEIAKNQSHNAYQKPTILFLRKFRTKSDHILPVFLSGAFGDKYNIVALSSQYLRKSLSFILRNATTIPIFKRIFHPFSYKIEFYYASDKEWLKRIEWFAKNADYVFIDISDISSNIISEIKLIIRLKKEEVTFFTKLIPKKNKDIDYETIKFLERYKFDIDRKLLIIPYLKPNFIIGKRKLFKSLKQILSIGHLTISHNKKMRELSIRPTDSNIISAKTISSTPNISNKMQINKKKKDDLVYSSPCFSRLKCFISIFRNKIPYAHPLRVLKKRFDSKIIPELAGVIQSSNAKTLGQVLFIGKVMILYILYNPKSEWEFIISLPLRLDWLWFLEFDIDDKINSSDVSLTHARSILKKDSFEIMFNIIIKHIIGLHLKKNLPEVPFIESTLIRHNIRNLNEKELESLYFIMHFRFIKRFIHSNNFQSQHQLIYKALEEESRPKRSLLKCKRIRIENLISTDHPIRQLKEKLNFDSLESLTKEEFDYKYKRNLPVPITILMRMLVLIIIYNIRSERELTAKLPMRLDWMWFLGYEWGAALPNKNVLSKARRCIGENMFKDLFEMIYNRIIESRIVQVSSLFSADRYYQLLIETNDEYEDMKSLLCKISYNIFNTK